MAILIPIAILVAWITAGYAAFALYVAFMKLIKDNVDEDMLILTMILGAFALCCMLIILTAWVIIKVLDPITQWLLEWARR